MKGLINRVKVYGVKDQSRKFIDLVNMMVRHRDEVHMLWKLALDGQVAKLIKYDEPKFVIDVVLALEEKILAAISASVVVLANLIKRAVAVPERITALAKSTVVSSSPPRPEPQWSEKVKQTRSGLAKPPINQVMATK